MATNKYSNAYNQADKFDYASFTNTVLTWTGTGTSIGYAAGGPLGWIGSIVGGVVGVGVGLADYFFGRDEKRQAVIDQAESDIRTSQANLKVYTTEWQKAVQNAQTQIDYTRASIDQKYGEGMYDIFDDLLNQIYGMEPGTTLSDLLENASVNTYVDLNGGADLMKTLSINQISEGYQEYLKNLIMNANSEYAYRTAQEQSYFRSYYTQTNQTILEYQRSFENAFLQRIEENSDLSMAQGSAEAQQATSGFRQTGGGIALTTYQQFQNDLAEITYASSISYMLKSFQMQIESIRQSTMDSVEQIRWQSSISAEEDLMNALEQFNQNNVTLDQSYDTIGTYEDAVDIEIDAIDEAEDFLVAKGKMSEEDRYEIDLEDIRA